MGGVEYVTKAEYKKLVDRAEKAADVDPLWECLFKVIVENVTGDPGGLCSAARDKDLPKLLRALDDSCEISPVRGPYKEVRKLKAMMANVLALCDRHIAKDAKDGTWSIDEGWDERIPPREIVRLLEGGAYRLIKQPSCYIKDTKENRLLQEVRNLSGAAGIPSPDCLSEEPVCRGCVKLKR